jgi:hypothetical protein
VVMVRGASDVCTLVKGLREPHYGTTVRKGPGTDAPCTGVRFPPRQLATQAHANWETLGAPAPLVVFGQPRHAPPAQPP